MAKKTKKNTSNKAVRKQAKKKPAKPPAPYSDWHQGIYPVDIPSTPSFGNFSP